MAPLRTYVVAATPRTGSSLLCEGLWNAGVAGRPGEVFAPMMRQEWCDYWSLPRDVAFADFLRAARTHGTGPNGVFGVKLMWMHVAGLGREAGVDGDESDVLDALFPGAAYVNIVRHDKQAQARSWARAIETGVWWRFRDEPPPPAAGEPQPELVAALAAEGDAQQAGWERHFERRGITPLTVAHESLDADYEGEIARVLAFLGLDPAAARDLPAPRLVRQS